MSGLTEQLQQAGRALRAAAGRGPTLPAYWQALHLVRLDYWQRYQHHPDIGPPPRPPVAPVTARALEKQRRRALGQAKARKRSGGPEHERAQAAYIFSQFMTDRGRFRKNRYRRQDDLARCRQMIKRKFFINSIPSWYRYPKLDPEYARNL